MELNKTEIENRAGISRRYIDFILNGTRTPSPKLASILEEVTGIDRRAWLWPEEFENPVLTRKAPPAGQADSPPKVPPEAFTAGN